MGKTWRSIFSASNLVIAKGAPIFVVIFAAFAQVLAWIGAISLSTTQQVMIWLVVAGLLVLFSIADMACRAAATVKRHEVSVVWPQGPPPYDRVIPAVEPTLSADGNPGNGSRLPAGVAENGNP